MSMKSEFSKICLHCGKPYVAKSAKSLYCKNSHRIAAHKIRHGIPMPNWKADDFNRIPSQTETELKSAINILGELTRKKDEAEKAYHSGSYNLSLENKYNELIQNITSIPDTYFRYRKLNPYNPSEYTVDKKVEKYTKLVVYFYESIIGLENIDTLQKQYIQCKKYVIDAYLKSKATEEEKNKVKVEEFINGLYNQIADTERTIKLLQKGYSLEELKNQNKILSRTDVLNIEIERYNLGDNHPFINVIGNPERSFIALVHGSAGSGKSSFAMQFADFFSNYAKTVYLPIEEGIASLTLQDKINRYTNFSHINFSGHTNLDLINKDLNANFDLIVVDSIAGWSVEDIQRLTIKRKATNTSYLFIMHETKGGEFKGDSSFGHLADIILKAENGLIKVEKNRYIKNINVPFKIWND